MPSNTPTWRLYVPKLFTVLRQGYGAQDLRRDLIAGLTVAIVALPLSMALAIASGAPPAVGLHTAIVAGFLISLFGGRVYRLVVRQRRLFRSYSVSSPSSAMTAWWSPP